MVIKMSWKDILKSKGYLPEHETILRNLNEAGKFRRIENENYPPGINTKFKEAMKALWGGGALPEEKAEYFEGMANEFGKDTAEGELIMEIVEYYKGLELDDSDYQGIYESRFDV